MENGNAPERKIEFGEGFFRRLGFDDGKVFANIELGIELYQGKHDRDGRVDAGVNFERALGVFSVSYVRIAHEILRNREAALAPEQRLFLNFGALDPRLVQSRKIIDVLLAECVAKHRREMYEIFYLDEWLDKIARGAIALTSDVAQVKRKSKDEEDDEKLKAKKDRLEGELDAFFREEKTRRLP